MSRINKSIKAENRLVFVYTGEDSENEGTGASDC